MTSDVPGPRVGPLVGLRVLEFQAIGPVPFAGMILSDLGAEVIRVVRVPAGGAAVAADRFEVMERGRRSIAVDLKDPRGVELVLRLIEDVDVLMEGWRPSVAERLGLGPDVCLPRNERLVYGRMTGWGQTGPLATEAGHDINFMALSGVLHALGRAGSPPSPPLSLVGDFGGGGMILVIGLLAALRERDASGKGQVIDAAMVDGINLLAAFMHGMIDGGTWSLARSSNVLDSGAPFYDTYAAADGGFVAVGAIEPLFWSNFVALMELPTSWLVDQNDKARWPAMKEVLRARFLTRPRDEWVRLLSREETCVSAVLDPVEARSHPQHVERGLFVTVDAVAQPGPAPRLGRTPGAVSSGPRAPGADTAAILAESGLSEGEVSALRAAGVVA
jgi:alpha-methylacyl-CoA racemase